MAYNSNNLSVLAYAYRFTLWHYTTEDTHADVHSARYFEPAADMLRSGDLIIYNAKDNNGFIFFHAPKDPVDE